MQTILLTDFGSTFTKLTAVNLDEACVLGHAQAFTTASSDITEGLDQAMTLLEQQTGNLEYRTQLACSSAAGGLNMIACGLVPSLTAKAARLAAFGAGAKVIKTYAYRLTRRDLDEILHIKPDILLLCGGTDGGNSEVVLHNADLLSLCPLPFPVIYAGNREAAEECEQKFKGSTHDFYLADNVMPSLNKLNVAPTQEIIRHIFLERIIYAKGLSKQDAVNRGIVMPTPSAVLEALKLLSEGTPKQPGIGELMAVDVGGATTDVYSIAKGLPSKPGTLLYGLKEPYEKRTVEGDIGMRYGAPGIVEAAGLLEVCEISGLSESRVQELLQLIGENKGVLPQEEGLKALDRALSVLAIRLGLSRHAGEVEQVFTPGGAVFRQLGKDLTGVQTLIMTGGALIHSPEGQELLTEAVKGCAAESLVPQQARVIQDQQYILSAMGLLATYDREAALHILLQYFGKGDNHGLIESKNS